MRLTFSLPAAYSLRCGLRPRPRRSRPPRKNGSLRYIFENYAFDTDRRQLHRGTDLVSVGPQVFDVLSVLERSVVDERCGPSGSLCKCGFIEPDKQKTRHHGYLSVGATILADEK